jgi:putative ABC transport system ATP-binding protein
MALLRRSCDELGQTVIAVTHDPRAAAYAGRAVFLKDGQVINETRFEPDLSHSERLRKIIEIMEQLEL